MFGISTSWNSHKHNNARSMIQEIKKLGIDYVELNFQLSKEMVDGVVELVKEGNVSVWSIHNFCPVPDSVDIKKASPDYYSLSAIDEKEGISQGDREGRGRRIYCRGYAEGEGRRT
jgi:hypothetical protein